MADEQNSKIKIFSFFGPIKDLAVSVAIFSSTLVVGVGVFKSATTDSLEFSPIQVPEKFTAKGYSPDISTARLIDQIRRINSSATTTKARSTVPGAAPGEALAKIDNLPMPSGIDLKALRDFVKEVFGVEQKIIGGEITLTGNDANPEYLVHIRESPTNTLLVNEVFSGQPEDVLTKVALRIVEKIDPVVAASYYRNNKNQVEALRMIDAALSNSNKSDDTFALSQRAQIYKAQKKFDLAKEDLDLLLSIDPQSPQGLGVMSAWYNEQGRFDEGLRYAELQIKSKPDMWYAYFNKADALVGKKQNALTVYRDGLKLKPTRSYAYVEAASYFSNMGNQAEAKEALLAGAAKFPAATDVNFAYGVFLSKSGHEQLAIHYLTKAYCLNVDDRNVKEVLISVLKVDEKLMGADICLR